ncbi:MAG: IS3 family transposase [Chloroflexota bacterium]
MGTARRPYPEEFKAEAVRLAQTSGKSIRQVALDLGVSNETLGVWVREARGREVATPLGADERAELAELRRRVKVLETEREILKKAGGLLRLGDRPDPVSVFRFVAQERAVFPVATMCRVLGVSPSGFWAWRRRGPSERARDDAGLTDRIVTIHRDSRGTYGSPRIHAELVEGGEHVSRKRIARLMRAAGIAGVHRRRFAAVTERDPDAAPAPDLVRRDFHPDGPDRLWVADITALPTSAGFLYLAIVLDAWSRRVVGWSMDRSPSGQLVTRALDMAITARRPKGGLIHHSDHGSQYTSLAFGARMRRAGIAASMGTVGDSYDNAMAESFFASLETELIDRTLWRTHGEARADVFDWVEVFYNRVRRHSALGYLAPVRFEEHHRQDRSTAA